MSITHFFSRLKDQKADFLFFPFRNNLQPYLFLFTISILIYINTFNHEVAYDDETVLHKNEFVFQGLSGITGILTHDSYYSYYKQLGMENNLPGGRYRPLSQVSFAIEQEFIGTIPSGIIDAKSWDVNKNGVQDQFEDTNGDGLYSEFDFWSKGSGFRHIVNVILYAFLILLIYHFLSLFLFPGMKDMVFLCALIFSVHPLHTEVVANIKSRDEIMSMIFILLTLLYSVKFILNPGNKNLIFSSVFMLLALLSKEYALLLFGLTPAILFVFYPDSINLKDFKFWLMNLLIACSAAVLILFFNSGTLIATPVLLFFLGLYLMNNSSKPAAKIQFALGISLVIYLSMRFSATIHNIQPQGFEQDIIANPYKFANQTQLWSSKIVVWLRYLKLFFVPDPLVLDYSYKSIPYSDLSDWKLWLSLLVYSGFILCAIFAFFKKSKWLFPFLLILGFFLPVANVFVNIGATMGERLFFHASLGVTLLTSLILFYFVERSKIDNKKIKIIVLSFSSIVVLFFALLTVFRNPDWKNNHTLFLADVKKVPENINVLYGAGNAYSEMCIAPINKANKLEYAKKANDFFNKSLSIYPNQYPVYMNKAINFYYIDELDSALYCSDKVLETAPTLPAIHRVRGRISDHFMYRGITRFEKGEKKDGMNDLLKSIKANKKNVRAWNNLGKALLSQGAKDKALSCYQSALQLDPKNEIAQKAIAGIQEKKSE